jgi:cyclohexadienyl dehydratase
MTKSLYFILCMLLLMCEAHAQQAPAVTAVSGNGPSRLDEIIARGVLHACTTGDYKPYSFLKPDGQFEGLDIELTGALARSLGVKAEFIKTSWSNLMIDFIGKCDVAVGGISTTLDRQKQAFFTQPIGVDGKTPIVRCSDVDKYQTMAEIDQQRTRVTVNPGKTNEPFARRYFSHAVLNIYPDNTTSFKQIL